MILKQHFENTSKEVLWEKKNILGSSYFHIMLEEEHFIYLLL